MKQVSLRFTSMSDLSEFATIVGHHIFLLGREHLILTGEFSEPEIELAMYAFGACLDYRIPEKEIHPPYNVD